jgi:anion-transporting  ArsA/GET3 family ATPase
MSSKEINPIDAALFRRKILITCGTGGVGKTTLSAAIAIRAALLGKKTVVITIDPAKRLATSLGLETLQDQATDLTTQIQKAFQAAKAQGLGVPSEFKGSLHAIVPDTRKTFESFVRELAPDPMAAERIMQNPIFQIFAKEFSGTNEYMALERLLSLSKRSEFDCIILDTPPSRNTLTFLDAPRILTQFFEEKVIRWLVIPANKIVAIGMKKALGVLEKLTGAGFMTNLFDFASALFEVQVKFAGSVKKITALLESSRVGFLIVTTPTPEATPEASHFIDTLKNRGFQFEGVALNRTLGYLKTSSSTPETAKEPEKGSENDSSPAFEILQRLQAREDKVLKTLKENQIPICAKLPELARDIHSVEDLFHVALSLGHLSDQPSSH